MGQFRSGSPSYIAALLTACCAILWIVFATYFGPHLIAAAYHSQSTPSLNSFVHGQGKHPLSAYLTSWRALSIRVLLGLLFFGFAITIITLSRVQLALWGNHPVEDEEAEPLSRLRITLIYPLLGAIAWGSFFCIVTGAERWPFSRYSMYSQIEKSYSLTQFRLYGVTQGEPGTEFPLTEYSYTQPFDNARLDSCFDHLYSHQVRPQEMRLALWDFLSRYERLRERGRHHGPPLRALRLYKAYWTLDPVASNVDHPDRKDLIAEVEGSDAPAQP